MEACLHTHLLGHDVWQLLIGSLSQRNGICSKKFPYIIILSYFIDTIPGLRLFSQEGFCALFIQYQHAPGKAVVSRCAAEFTDDTCAARRQERHVA